jgi:putative molybdopterin biosynthesis protein
LSFVGSHDLLIEQVRRMLADRKPELHLSVDYRGSLGGLIALAQEEAEVAGVHLWDEESGEYNLPYVERLLPGRRVALVTLAHRQLGLILPPGNPHGIRGLADLPGSGARWVNRQRGSGTRVWLEARLRALGISPRDLPGFEREENTHLAVARAVADGEAEAGLGIYAAAAAAGLDFVPLARERYDLVVLEPAWNRPVFREVLALLRSRAFRETVDALGGYELEEDVRERWVG